MIHNDGIVYGDDGSSKVAWLLHMNFCAVNNATNILVLFKALW
jgi:hypothetical protein